MSSTNHNSPHAIRHHSKHTRLSSDEFSFYIDAIGSAVRESLVVFDKDLRVYFANRAFYDLLKIDAESAKGRHCYELSNRALETAEFRRLF